MPSLNYRTLVNDHLVGLVTVLRIATGIEQPLLFGSGLDGRVEIGPVKQVPRIVDQYGLAWLSQRPGSLLVDHIPYSGGQLLSDDVVLGKERVNGDRILTQFFRSVSVDELIVLFLDSVLERGEILLLHDFANGDCVCHDQRRVEMRGHRLSGKFVKQLGEGQAENSTVTFR